MWVNGESLSQGRLYVIGKRNFDYVVMDFVKHNQG